MQSEPCLFCVKPAQRRTREGAPVCHECITTVALTTPDSLRFDLMKQRKIKPSLVVGES